MAKAWVPDGIDNPDLRAMKVFPRDGCYRDTDGGKVVDITKMVTATTGNTHDDGGVKGTVKVWDGPFQRTLAGWPLALPDRGIRSATLLEGRAKQIG